MTSAQCILLLTMIFLFQIFQTFSITVLPVDNSLPFLENAGIRVQEGVRKTITEFELRVMDADTKVILPIWVCIVG